MPKLPLVVATVILFLNASLLAQASAAPYVDPSQLDVPWPKHSFYKQPWRAYLETRSAADFLSGIGVAYHVPGNDELAIAMLAEAGVKALRIEIGWGSMSFDESGISGGKRWAEAMQLIKKHNIRPIMLLNAHQGVPCPVQFFKKRLAADAAKGATAIQLADTSGLVVGKSGLSGLTEYWAAEALITGIDPATGRCQLSKPLPKDIKAGDVSMATLKYLPLYPASAPEFDQTARGWVKYALAVCDMVAAAGIEDFDIEIWNELTFGTKFLNINNYYQPKKIDKVPDFLNPGGNCWELARRTVDAVKGKYPKARCIWGFSNTTFYHCAIEKLPPGTDGQTYHPYGTGVRSLPKSETHKDRPDYNLEGYTPTLDIRMPEGWAQTFIQTECLVRLFNPKDRLRTPQGTKRFYQYITEHGVLAEECGITDEAGAWNLKTKCALRSYCMFLNKGIDALYYFCAYDAKAGGFGLLPTNLPKLPAGTSFDSAATPPLKAMRNLTRAFAGAVPIAASTQLRVEVTPAGPIGAIFPGDAKHPPLTHRDVFAFLPWQVNQTKFIAAVYVMTYDVTKPMTPEKYRLTISGLPSAVKKLSFYDLVQNADVPAQIITQNNTTVEVEVTVSDCPRLLVMEL